MSSYALTPLAKADIFEIWSFIAEDSEETADRVEQAIYDACAFVAQAPMRGHSRSDLTSRSLHFWTLTRYPGTTPSSTGLKRLLFKRLPFLTGKEICDVS